MTITTDFNDIRKRRLKNRETSIKRDLEYNTDEKETIRRLPRNSKTTHKLLNKSRKDSRALQTYVKYQLNHCNPLLKALDNIILSCNRHKIPVPHKPENNDENRYKWYLHDIYRYCYDHNLISPEDDVMSIPMEWLGKQIEQKKEPLRWLTLLKKSLRIKLLKTRRIASLADRLGRHTPNPLRCYEKPWTPEEVERFAGIVRLTQHVTTPETLDFYHSLHGAATCQKLSQQVYEAARKGDLDAQKAIITRRLPSTHISGLLTYLKTPKGNINLLVNGSYRTPDKQILIKFIKQHFNRDKQKLLLGYLAYTDQELLDSLKNKSKHTSSINAEIHRRIRSSGNTLLLKQFITERLKTTRDLSTLMHNINQAEIKYKGQSPFTNDHLCQLFQPGENDAIEKVFQRTTSTDALFEELLGQGFYLRKIHQQLLKRCKDSRDVTLRYIKLCRQLSKQSTKHFCTSHVSKFNKHRVPTFTEGLPVWTYRSIKQITASISPITPRCISTTGKSAPATHSEYAQTKITKAKPCPVKPERLPMARVARLNTTKAYQQPRMKNKYWAKVKWCGDRWWSNSSDMANFSANHTSNSVQDLKKANPELYDWLERMQQSLIKAKTNKIAL